MNPFASPHRWMPVVAFVLLFPAWLTQGEAAEPPMSFSKSAPPPSAGTLSIPAIKKDASSPASAGASLSTPAASAAPANPTGAQAPAVPVTPVPGAAAVSAPAAAEEASPSRQEATPGHGFSFNGEWSAYEESAAMHVDMTSGNIRIKEHNHTESFTARADVLAPSFLRLTLYDERGNSLPVTLCALDTNAMAVMFGDSDMMLFFREGAPVPPINTSPPTGSFSLVHGENSSLSLDFTRKVALKDGEIEAPLNARPAASPFSPGALMITLEGTEAGVAVQMGDNILLVFEADDPTFPVLAFGRTGGPVGLP